MLLNVSIGVVYGGSSSIVAFKVKFVGKGVHCLKYEYTMFIDLSFKWPLPSAFGILPLHKKLRGKNLCL
jgi:hypothetical protein